MKKQLFVFAGLFIISVALVSWNSRSTTFVAAQIDNDFGCALFDGDGNLVLADASHSVINDDGTTFKCSVKGTTNSSHKAVTYAGFGCNTLAGVTFDTKETVSAVGNATLTCVIDNVNP